ncbi:MAG: sigma-70 family RNA polymerase sigma factor [Pseudomonadota bacterium]
MFQGERRRSFETVVRAHAADLYRYGFWLCRDRFVAEDLVQETFTRAWKAWGDLKDPQAAKAWLFSILHREHARLYERKRLDSEALDPDAEWASAEPAVESALSTREALERLPPAYREPLLLQVLGGFACAEIAAALEISEAAVLQRVSRARRAMRETLSQGDELWTQAK